MMRKILLFVLGVLMMASCASRKEQQPLENSVVYEMNVRQYTPEGTFASAQMQLPRLS